MLVDGRMRGALANVRPGAPRPWVIFLSPEPGDDWSARALRAGAKGVLEPGAAPEDVFKAIRAVHEGQIWARNELVFRVLEELVAQSEALHSIETLLAERLGAREQEVTRHVSSGLSNKEIAERMSISAATVKAYLSSVFRKLNVRDRGQLIALYHRTRRTFRVPGSETAEPAEAPLRSPGAPRREAAKPLALRA